MRSCMHAFAPHLKPPQTTILLHYLPPLPSPPLPLHTGKLCDHAPRQALNERDGDRRSSSRLLGTQQHSSQHAAALHALSLPHPPPLLHAQAVAVHERLEPTKSERLLEYPAVTRAKLLLAGKRCSQ